MKSFLALFFLCSVVVSPLFGSQVLETGLLQRHLLISQEKSAPFQVGEYLCVIQQGREAACGFVIRAGSEVTIDLEFRSTEIFSKSLVRRAVESRPCEGNLTNPELFSTAKKAPLAPFLRTCTDEEKQLAGKYQLPARYFFGLALNMVNPIVFFEFAPIDSLSVGASLNFYDYNRFVPTYGMHVNGNSYGAHALFTYYPMGKFDRFSIKGKVGYVQGRMKCRGALADWGGLSLAAMATFRLSDWQNHMIGLSIGAYHFSLHRSEEPTTAHFILPIIALEVGVGFI